MIESLSVIMPTFHSKDLVLIAIRSFEHFKPPFLRINYIIVENSDDISYRQDVMSLSENVTWINNQTHLRGSAANAVGLEIGLKQITTEWVFLAHCDVCVSSSLFFEELFRKAEEGYSVIGTEFDPSLHRIKALHISGIFLQTSIAKRIDYYPRILKDGRHMDVGDGVTLYCRENGIKHFCFKNTFNYPEVVEKIDKKFKVQVDRCINNNSNVIFMHLGRGIPKTEGTYKTEGKTFLQGWIKLCNGVVLCE